MNKTGPFSEFRALLSATLFVAILSYATNIFLANQLGADTFGKYSYALTLGALFGQLICFGTNEVGVRLKTTYGAPALDWIFTLKLLNLIIIFGTLTVSVFASKHAIALLGLVVALSALSLTTHYEAHGKNLRYAKIFLAERSLITLLLWLGLLLSEVDDVAFIFITLFLVQTASLIFQYHDNQIKKPRLTLTGLSKAYRDGFYMLAFGLAKFAFGGITRIVIFHQLGDTKTGIFATAWQFVPLSTMYFSQAVKAWRVRITQAIISKDETAFRKQLLSISAAIFLPALFASSTLYLFGTNIIDLLFSQDYSAATELMPYLSLYLLVVGFDTVVVLLAVAISLSRFACFSYLVFGALTVLSCIFVLGDRDLNAYLLTIIIGHFAAAATLAGVTATALRNNFLR